MSNHTRGLFHLFQTASIVKTDVTTFYGDNIASIERLCFKILKSVIQ